MYDRRVTPAEVKGLLALLSSLPQGGRVILQSKDSDLVQAWAQSTLDRGQLLQLGTLGVEASKTYANICDSHAQTTRFPLDAYDTAWSGAQAFLRRNDVKDVQRILFSHEDVKYFLG